MTGQTGVYSEHLKVANEKRKIKHSFVDGVEGKNCSMCKKWKPLSDFANLRKSADGLSYRCKSCLREKIRKYRDDYSDEIEERRKTKEYRKEYRRKKREYQRKKRSTDINYRLRGNLRSRVRQAIKNNVKSGHTLDLLGCTIRELKQYLEVRFQEGMTWDNWGMDGWHIDHIIPCTAFDLSVPGQQRKCFHYTNLQPLWAEDNKAKGDTIPEGIEII